MPDTPTDEDKLGFDRFAGPLAANIAAIDRGSTPWTIGVYGEWGSGKTSFLMMVDKALRAEGVRPIWFNAWKYVREDNLWAALIHTILDEAKRGSGPWVRLRIWAKSVDFRAGSWELLRKLAVLGFRVAMLAVLVLMTISLIPVGVNPVNDAVVRSLAGSSLVGIYNFPGSRVVIGIAALLLVKPDAVLKLFDIKLGADFGKFRRRRAHRDQTALLDDFNTEFRGVLDVAHRKKPLVVIIDDLDRCLPEQTLQIIETVKLFLDEPGCVFLLAVDREIIEHAIAVKYKDLPELESRRQLGETYFEKVVQLPYSLPPAADSRIEEFIRDLSGDPDVHECVPILRGAPPYNPRRIKRSVQAFALLKDFASRELTDSTPVPAVLAKLVVIQAQFRQVYRAAVDDHGLLGKLEKAYRTPGSIDEDLVFTEQVKRYTERYPALRMLLCQRVSEGDTFVGVSLVKYLSFVDSVAVAEEPEPPAKIVGRAALVSYVRDDVRWGEWLVAQLTGRGYAVTTADPQHPMQDLDESSFRQVFGLVSDAAVRSGAAQRAWAAAIASDADFLPVQVGRCELPEVLADRRVLDLTGLDDEQARSAFANAVAGHQEVTNEISGTVMGSVVQVHQTHFPGIGAAINNVPLTKVGGVHREKLLSRVSACFSESSSAAGPRICALVGIPGSGKSDLAQRYARDNADRYDVVWWVRGSLMSQDWAGLAQALEVPVERVHQALAARGGRWLLIFDGVGSPEDVAVHLPSGGTGNVLITSAHRLWGSYGTLVDVGPMTTAEAVALLDQDGADGDVLAEIAELLAHLPASLAVAAGYMRDTATSADGFLRLLYRHGWSVLEAPRPSVEERINDLVEGAVREDPLAVQVRRVLAFLGPGDAPRDLVFHMVTDDQVAFDRAVALLHRVSLVNFSANAIGAHEIIRRVVREELDTDTTKKVLERALLGATPALVKARDSLVDRTRAEQVIEHVLTLTSHAEHILPLASAEVLAQAGRLRHALGDWTVARALGDHALELDKRCTTAVQLKETIDLVRVRPTPFSSRPHVEIVAIGRSGHGKSALAGAICDLLAAGPPTVIADGTGGKFEYQTAARHYAHVECADSAALVRCLVTGAIQPDCALVVVAASDGPRPETREQLVLMRAAGVRHVVAALTKCDLVEEHHAITAENNLRTLLSDVGYPGAEVVRLSAREPDQVASLVRVLDDSVPTPSLLIDGAFRLPIESASTWPDNRAVVMGRVASGLVEVGDEIEIVGGNLVAKSIRIGSIEVNDTEQTKAAAGDKVVLELSNVPGGLSKPGMVAAHPGSTKSCTVFEVLVDVRSDHLAPKDDDQVGFEFRGVRERGTISSVGSAGLPPDGAVIFTVTMDRPIVVEPGDRFEMEGGFKGMVTRVRG